MEGNSKLRAFTFEMEGDTHTPISIYKKLCGEGKSFILESVEKGKWGKYSYIGRKPFMEIRSEGSEVTLDKSGVQTSRYGKPLEILRDVIKEHGCEGLLGGLDFEGGAVGYIAYDFVRNIEKLGEPEIDDLQMPDMHLFFPEEIVAYEHERQKIKVIINMPLGDGRSDDELEKDAEERLQAIKAEIESPEAIESKNPLNKQEVIKYSGTETKESFMSKVEKAKQYIKDGDIFQVVLSQRFDVKTSKDPLDVYRTLRILNPSPYMYFIDYGDYKIAGSSPELLVKLRNGEVETCPIAGTRHRGATLEEDERLCDELLKDEKERAEHMMLVDLARNDIGRISQFGSVELSSFMEVQRYSHVMHIVSNVKGKVREGYDMLDALSSCMPAGTVSGAPKVRAMQIIDELENRKRGVYAGAIGYFGFNGNMDTCIAIRTVLFKGDTAYVQAGAGIVADSDPLSEYNETQRKAQAVLEALRD